jgi:hypothetical protein
LRSLEEFRKNPHVKITPKSLSTNFQSLGKFKNPIFNSKILFLDFGPADLAAHPASQPSQPTGRAIFRRLKAPSRPIQPTRESRLRGKYVFLFGSRLPSRPRLPHLSVNRAPDVSFIPHLQPPKLTHAATDSWPPSTAQLRALGAIEPLPPRLHFNSLNFPP